MKTINTRDNRISATPRSKYYKYGIYTGEGSSVSSGSGGTTITNYVKLKGEKELIIDGSVGATGNIVAYQTTPDKPLQIPMASKDVLGGIKLGKGFQRLDDGTVNVIGGGSGGDTPSGGGVSSWAEIAALPDFPESFTPSKHTHTKSEITDFKHTHTKSEITDFKHTHTKSEITDFAHTHDIGDIKLGTDQLFVTNAEKTKWNDAANKAHTHNNKDLLDVIDQKLHTDANVHFRNVWASENIIAYEKGLHGPLQIPMASKDVLGGIKLGKGFQRLDDGTVNVIYSGGGSGGGVSSWAEIAALPDFPESFTPSEHNHDTRYYTKDQIKNELLSYSLVDHTHDNRYYTESEIDSKLNGKSDTGHTHDNRYYTESEIDSKLNGKSDTGHTHDNRYYTESEMDTKLNNKADKTDSRFHTHSNKNYLDSINQHLSTSSDAQFRNVYASENVVAYSKGAAQSPFKYWKPNVSSDGTLSWENSSSTSTPASRNIRGPLGQQGPAGPQGPRGSNGTNGRNGTNGVKGDDFTSYWNGTKLCIGYRHPDGIVTWGNEIDLRGPAGPTGSGWNGGTVNNPIFVKMGPVPLKLNSGGAYAHFKLGTSDYDGNALTIHINSYDGSNWNTDTSYEFSTKRGAVAKNSIGWVKDSDIRLKNVTKTEDNVLDKIKNLKPIHFTWKSGNPRKEIGLSALEVVKVFPEVIAGTGIDNDYYVLDYSTLGAVVAVGGLNEMNQKVISQQKEIDDLKLRIEKLENIINKLTIENDNSKK